MSTPHPKPDLSKDRRLVLFFAIGVALISTGAAYTAMVAFARDVLAMTTYPAWAFAGVFELSLVTVALMAREAAKADRPNGTLLVLTWVLSGASGFFAAFHEQTLGNPVYASVFRICVPLLAALMWHLALVGDRHLAMQRSFTEMRAGARVWKTIVTAEEVALAEQAFLKESTRVNQRRLKDAVKRHRRVRSVTLKTIDPDTMDAHIDSWVGSFFALGRGITFGRVSVGAEPDTAALQAAAHAVAATKAALTRASAPIQVEQIHAAVPPEVLDEATPDEKSPREGASAEDAPTELATAAPEAVDRDDDPQPDTASDRTEAQPEPVEESPATAATAEAPEPSFEADAAPVPSVAGSHAAADVASVSTVRLPLAEEKPARLHSVPSGASKPAATRGSKFASVVAPPPPPRSANGGTAVLNDEMVRRITHYRFVQGKDVKKTAQQFNCSTRTVSRAKNLAKAKGLIVEEIDGSITVVGLTPGDRQRSTGSGE